MKILYVTRHFNRSGYYILESLIRHGFNICAIVVSDDDNPLRYPLLRHFVIAWYRIKCLYYRCEPCRFTHSEELLARHHGIQVIRTNDINSHALLGHLRNLSPDIIVLGGGRNQLLSPRVYTFPCLGTVNTHPSLLPHFRGTSIHRWQILHGVTESGTTIHYVDNTFDTGKILAQVPVQITINDTPQSLFEKTARAGAELMPQVLMRLQDQTTEDSLQTVSQTSTEPHYFSRWTWDPAALRIDWTKSFVRIHNLIRACHQESYEYLGPTTILGDKTYFVRRSFLNNPRQPASTDNNKAIEIVAADRLGLHLARGANQSRLIINQIQPAWGRWWLKRAFHASRLIRLRRVSVGDTLSTASENGSHHV